MKKDIHTTVFRLPPMMHKELRIAAINAGLSMAEAIRQAIELWLKRRQKPKKVR
jgi:Arc/MetJ-type ribon-helix-helix transcriptional regulator